jgi:transcriptional regulator with XRE-family HTH domain
MSRHNRPISPPTPPNPNTPGGKLALARYKKNLSQHEVAKMLGVTPQMISLWEKNQQKTPARRLEQLKKIYETSLQNAWASPPADVDEFADRQEQLEHQVTLLAANGKMCDITRHAFQVLAAMESLDPEVLKRALAILNAMKKDAV